MLRSSLVMLLSPRLAPPTAPAMAVRMLAAPKRGGIVDSYQTVSVVCAGCNERLFRYKKKNGMKSSLVKCYIERICEDSAGLLASRAALAEAGAAGEAGTAGAGGEWQCPECQTTFARNALIHGRPALKLVGGKVRMAKK